MIFSSSAVATDCTPKPKRSWPIVALLLFMAGVPGLPAIFILVSIAIGPPADGSVHSFVNMLHYTKPLPVIVHGGAGIVFFLTMPFQFSAGLRRKHKIWHRFAGYMTIISGYVIACSSPWMHQVFTPDSGLPRVAGMLTMSAGIVIAFSLALRFVLGGNIKQHRTWMMRAVAITLAPITAAFFGMLIEGFYEFYPGLSQLEFGYARWFGMIINLAIVQYVLFKERTTPARTGSHISLGDGK